MEHRLHRGQGPIFVVLALSARCGVVLDKVLSMRLVAKNSMIESLS